MNKTSSFSPGKPFVFDAYKRSTYRLSLKENIFKFVFDEPDIIWISSLICVKNHSLDWKRLDIPLPSRDRLKLSYIWLQEARTEVETGLLVQCMIITLEEEA